MIRQLVGYTSPPNLCYFIIVLCHIHYFNMLLDWEIKLIVIVIDLQLNSLETGGLILVVQNSSPTRRSLVGDEF